MGTMHEVGHAMYEHGLNEAYNGLPVSKPLSRGVHESQSVFWERIIGRNLAFWQAVLPQIHERLPHTKEVTAEDLFFAINQVQPGLKRLVADELTYPFHIMFRFDLERKLVSGELAVEDLPEAWNKGMKEYLGVDVPSNLEGCLQEMQWPSGAFGYFPSYALGAMMAAQLFSYVNTKAIPDFEERMASDDFSTIQEWMRHEIHEVGSLYPSLDDLLMKVTGEPLNPTYFVEYLNDKYTKVYVK